MRRFVLNESLHFCLRFLGRVVFKPSSNSAVLRLSIKNTLDISHSPGGICLWFSLMPLWTLSTHLFFTGATVLSLQIRCCREIPQWWVVVLVKAVQESWGVLSQNPHAWWSPFLLLQLFVFELSELHPHKAKTESAGDLEHFPDEHVVWRQGAQELIKHHI